MNGRLRAWPSAMTMGVGPAMVLLTIAYILAAVALVAVYPGLKIPALDHGWVRVIGWVLLAGAAVLYVPTISTVRRAAEEDRLVTDGLFARVRNPIYALFIFFVCPGVGLIAATWPALASPVVAYALYRLLIPREEARLESRFGEAYLAYRRRVPDLVPRPRG